MMKLPTDAVIHRGVTDEQLAWLTERLGRALPADWVLVLKQTDGMHVQGSVRLYSVGEIAERNNTFKVSDYAAGYVAIGDDGGGKLILLSEESGGVFAAGQGALDPKFFQVLAASVQSWFLGGCALTVQSSHKAPQLVDVILAIAPSGGAHSLLTIKKLLRLDQSIAELKRLAAEAPVPLLRGVPYGKYLVRSRRVNEIFDCLVLQEKSE